MNLLIVELRKMRNCPICNKSVVVLPGYENAEITHMDCALSTTKDIRAEQKRVADISYWEKFAKG
jgi:hypothetical protein